MNVSEFDSIDEATESLISMSAAYDDLDKMDIVDKLNLVGNNFSISTDQLATGLKDSAAALSTAGKSLPGSIVICFKNTSNCWKILRASHYCKQEIVCESLKT